MDPESIARLVTEAALEKKGVDVLTLDVRPFLSIVDYFVIAGGNSTVHARAIAEAVEERLAQEGLHPSHRQGTGGGRWVLLDYGGVVVHVFHEEERDYYNLERLWQAAPRVDFSTRQPNP